MFFFLLDGEGVVLGLVHIGYAGISYSGISYAGISFAFTLGSDISVNNKFEGIAVVDTGDYDRVPIFV